MNAEQIYKLISLTGEAVRAGRITQDEWKDLGIALIELADRLEVRAEVAALGRKDYEAPANG
jgi:hypothetical protein